MSKKAICDLFHFCIERIERGFRKFFRKCQANFLVKKILNLNLNCLSSLFITNELVITFYLRRHVLKYFFAHCTYAWVYQCEDDFILSIF